MCYSKGNYSNRNGFRCIPKAGHCSCHNLKREEKEKKTHKKFKMTLFLSSKSQNPIIFTSFDHHQNISASLDICWLSLHWILSFSSMGKRSWQPPKSEKRSAATVRWCIVEKQKSTCFVDSKYTSSAGEKCSPATNASDLLVGRSKNMKRALAVIAWFVCCSIKHRILRANDWENEKERADTRGKNDKTVPRRGSSGHPPPSLSPTWNKENY